MIKALLRGLALLIALAGSTSFVAAASLSPIEELRTSFTVRGKPVPPEIFRDMGDGDLADSASIRVTIDVLAATGSNLYADDIKVSGDWIAQTSQGNKTESDKTGGLAQETSYRFIGATANKLLVVIASYNGGGSGTFYTLHILDARMGRGFDTDGKLYDRLNVTELRSVILGDRWEGTAKIHGNSIAIATTNSAVKAHDQKPAAKIIEAKRP
jgi:hypothetical protein